MDENGKSNCAGGMVVHADEAEVNEDTGEISPNGQVSIVPYQGRYPDRRGPN